MKDRELFNLEEMLKLISKKNLDIILKNDKMRYDINNCLGMGTGGRHLMEIASFPTGSVITKEHINFICGDFLNVVQELVWSNNHSLSNEVIELRLLESKK